jgi:MFS transporter, GlpU family, inner membrane protein
LPRVVLILVLIVAGEMVFGLPFHTARYFRPTMLDVFEISNTQLGDIFAVYGFAAMLAYFPGGAMADHFSARFLLTASLFATAVGGLYMATIPSAPQLAVLYGYWGLTTIFLFWGALIRATRDWGGSNAQGVAFGILEGGRGLTAAIVSSLGVMILAAKLPEIVEQSSDEQRRAAFSSVILLYTSIAAFAGVLTWLLIPVPDIPTRSRPNPLAGMSVVVRRPIVWAQAAVVVCAYCGYKGADNYSLYAVQVLNMNEVDGARFATWGAYIRPVAAVTAGLIADRFDAARSIGVAFLVLLLSYVSLTWLAPGPVATNLIVASIFVSFFAVFAIRGIYFALLEENKTPIQVTGAAVGLVSVIGFTPDFFFGPISGRILDASPGIGGHQNYFMFLAAIMIAGFMAIAWLMWLRRQGVEKLWPLETKS